MLPQSRSYFLRTLSTALLVAAALLGGCGEPETPEARVRAVIAAGERAAEDRDLSAILEHVSPSFRDAQGGGRDELAQYLRAYLVTHPTVHLLTRIDSVEFPYRDFARVRLTLGGVGREANGVGGLALDADVKEIALELVLEGDGWKVVRAEW
jgi:hypothetical protein